MKDVGKREEVEEDASERVQDTDGGGAFVEQDEEAVREPDDPVAAELRQADAEAPAGGRVEEGGLAGVGRVDAVAVAESDPAARAEANVPQRGVARAIAVEARQGAHTERKIM